MRGLRALLPLLLAAGAGCGPGPEISVVEVRLPLTFGPDALLEVFVLDEAAVACGALLTGEVSPSDKEPFDVARSPADRLNDGGRASFSFEELPAEVPLVFYARASEGGDVLSDACEGGVVIPVDGEVEIRLAIVERG